MSNNSLNNQVFFYILIRSWKAFSYFDRCIESVLHQKYTSYIILFIDDNSSYTRAQKNYIQNKLKKHIVVFNRVRKYSVRNAYEMIRKYATNEQAVVVNLDGDDWLYDNTVLDYLACVYKKKDCWFTYGECKVWDGNTIKEAPSYVSIPNANMAYSKTVRMKRTYRQEPFSPLHLRTWKVWLYNRILYKDFHRPDGSWLRYCEDMAIYFPMLEMAGFHCRVLKKPLSVYNIATPLNDVKRNINCVLKDELILRKKRSYGPFIK